MPGGWQEPEWRGTALWWAVRVMVSRSGPPEYGESERGCRRGRHGPGSPRVLKTEWRSLVFSGGQGGEGHYLVPQFSFPGNRFVGKDLGEVLCLGDDPRKPVREWGREIRWRGKSVKGVLLLPLWRVRAVPRRGGDPLTSTARLRTVHSRGKEPPVLIPCWSRVIPGVLVPGIPIGPM